MTDVDRNSETWASIEAWAQKELRSAFALLASAGVSERTADQLRGRIAALKDIQALGKRPAKEPDWIEPAKEYI